MEKHSLKLQTVVSSLQTETSNRGREKIARKKSRGKHGNANAQKHKNGDARKFGMHWFSASVCACVFSECLYVSHFLVRISFNLSFLAVVRKTSMRDQRILLRLTKRRKESITKAKHVEERNDESKQ